MKDRLFQEKEEMKMKKLLVLILTLTISVSLIACASNQRTDSESSDSSVSTANLSIDELTETPTENLTEDEGHLSSVDVNNEISFYQVPDTWINNHNGFYLQRENAYYYLSNTLPYSDQTSNCGYRALVEGERYMYYEEGGNNTKLSCGEIPIPIIRSDEKIRQYSNGDVFPLALYPANFTGYTIGAFHPARKEVYDLYDFSSGTSLESSKDIIVCGQDGIPVENMRDLEYNQEYIISWYIGTNYYEKSMVANCSCYDEKELEYIYTTEGDLTKNGYVEYDISQVPSGKYILGTKAAYGYAGHIIIEID